MPFFLPLPERRPGFGCGSTLAALCRHLLLRQSAYILRMVANKKDLDMVVQIFFTFIIKLYTASGISYYNAAAIYPAVCR